MIRFSYLFADFTFVRQQEGNLTRLRGDLKQLEQRSRDASREWEMCRQAISKHEKDAKDLRKAIAMAEKRVDDIQDRLDKATIDEGHLDALKANLQEAEENKCLQESSYQEAVVAKDKALDILRLEHQKLKDADENLVKATKEQQEVESELMKLAKQRETALVEKNKAFQNLEDAQQQLVADQAAKQDQIEIIKNYSELAGQVGPRIEIPPGETVDALEKKLQKFNSDVKRMDKV